ncbi:MAG: hypothetical protein PF961_12490 [Planctomycetota bacterium]|jgi:hypothetical protein|nr:hypothetical protein [Planctomycetota bacterium]
MDPNQISSMELPNFDFVKELAETLAEYGVEEDEVFALGPGVVNFIKYLMTDIEELEAEVIELRQLTGAQAKDLKRVRAQRIALLLKMQHLTGTLDDQDLSKTTLRVIKESRGEAS